MLDLQNSLEAIDRKRTALLYFTRGWLLAKKADLSHLLVIAPTEFMLGDSELAPILQAMSDSAHLSFILYDHTGKAVMTLLDENQKISKILIFQNPDKTPFEEVNKITSIIRMKDPDREGFFRWDSGYTYIKVEGDNVSFSTEKDDGYSKRDAFISYDKNSHQAMLHLLGQLDNIDALSFEDALKDLVSKT